MLLASTVAVGLSLPAAGVADFSSSSYTHSGDCGSTRAIDPITLVIYGPSAIDDNARYALETSMSRSRDPNWYGNKPTSWTPQYASSHGYCTVMDAESQDGSDVSNRSHLRYNQVHHRDTLGRWETVGTPHYDLRVYCGHRAQDFNWAKYYIAGGMYDGGYRGLSYQNWGNTMLLYQCDGTADRSDGQVAWVNIG